MTKQQIAALNVTAQMAAATSGMANIIVSAAAILELIGQLEAMHKDAERYRWLLNNYARGDGYNLIDAALNDGEPEKDLSPAIDAAMSAAPEVQL